MAPENDDTCTVANAIKELNDSYKLQLLCLALFNLPLDTGYPEALRDAVCSVSNDFGLTGDPMYNTDAKELRVALPSNCRVSVALIAGISVVSNSHPTVKILLDAMKDVPDWVHSTPEHPQVVDLFENAITYHGLDERYRVNPIKTRPLPSPGKNTKSKQTQTSTPNKTKTQTAGSSSSTAVKGINHLAKARPASSETSAKQQQQQPSKSPATYGPVNKPRHPFLVPNGYYDPETGYRTQGPGITGKRPRLVPPGISGLAMYRTVAPGIPAGASRVEKSKSPANASRETKKKVQAVVDRASRRDSSKKMEGVVKSGEGNDESSKDNMNSVAAVPWTANLAILTKKPE